MEVTPGRPATELASLMSAALQNTRVKDRRAREAESDVRNNVTYYSPVVRIDTDTQTAVLQYRNHETGEIKREFPAQSASDRYISAQENSSIPILNEEIVLDRKEENSNNDRVDLDS